jgi:hypothetical protein
MTRLNRRAEPGPTSPWWRYPIVWLVIGGPAAVVVAALVTAYVAIRGADEVLPHETNATLSEQPAVQGRNHAATRAAPR